MILTKVVNNRFYLVPYKKDRPTIDEISDGVKTWLLETDTPKLTVLFDALQKKLTPITIDRVKSDYTPKLFRVLANGIQDTYERFHKNNTTTAIIIGDKILDAEQSDAYIKTLQENLVNDWTAETQKTKTKNEMNQTRLANKAKDAERRRKEEFQKQVAEAEKIRLEQARKKAQKKSKK